MAPWSIEGTDRSSTILSEENPSFNLEIVKGLIFHVTLGHSDTLYLSVLDNGESIFIEEVKPGANQSRIFNPLETYVTGIRKFTWIPE